MPDVYALHLFCNGVEFHYAVVFHAQPDVVMAISHQTHNKCVGAVHGLTDIPALNDLSVYAHLQFVFAAKPDMAFPIAGHTVDALRLAGGSGHSLAACGMAACWRQ